MNRLIKTAEIHDTREHVALVATHLFANQGYDGTSLRDIVEAAGVTKPVIYYYFNSKENLFITLINDAYDFFLTAIEEIIDGEGDFKERLKKVTHLYFDLCSQYEDTTRLIYHTAFGPRGKIPPVDIMKLEEKHFALLLRFLSEGVELGEIRPGEIEPYVIHYLGAISVYMQILLLKGTPIPENAEDIMMDLVLNGIGGQNS